MNLNYILYTCNKTHYLFFQGGSKMFDNVFGKSIFGKVQPGM